jgi:hypothetical protein
MEVNFRNHFIFLKVGKKFACWMDGWMVSGQETVFCWVSVPKLTMVVTSVAFLTRVPK